MLSGLLMATETGSLRGPLRVTLPFTSPGFLWRYVVGSGAEAWDGDERSCLIFHNCHCTPSHLVNSVPALSPRGEGQQESPGCERLLPLLGGCLPWEVSP